MMLLPVLLLPVHVALAHTKAHRVLQLPPAVQVGATGGSDPAHWTTATRHHLHHKPR